MEKLNNWCSWFNDKIILHNIKTGLRIVINVNTVVDIEEYAEGSYIKCTEKNDFYVREDIETVAAIIKEAEAESKARQEAIAEKQRQEYAEMMKAQQQ